MKRVVAISLAFVFLGSNTELHQFLKLPGLFHHYMEHHDKDHDESFADFLNEHYTGISTHSDSHRDHGNLPFKESDCATMHNTFVYAPHFSLCEPIQVFVKISVASKVMLTSASFFSNIWQPPKIS